jgi:hypothetical protein
VHLRHDLPDLRLTYSELAMRQPHVYWNFPGKRAQAAKRDHELLARYYIRAYSNTSRPSVLAQKRGVMLY